ncbi:MAG: hypothetical protein ACT4PV_15285 [Planctomycetaceae bacterium]
MHCNMCKTHATFEHTFFRGTEPVKVHLCSECMRKVDAQGHVSKIKSATDKTAKRAAVDAFLKMVGK